jgi:hypothetical protein
MQTICHDFNKKLSSPVQLNRRKWWRTRQSARGSRPLRIFVIKTLSMIMVRMRTDGYAKGSMLEA